MIFKADKVTMFAHEIRAWESMLRALKKPRSIYATDESHEYLNKRRADIVRDTSPPFATVHFTRANGTRCQVDVPYTSVVDRAKGLIRVDLVKRFRKIACIRIPGNGVLHVPVDRVMEENQCSKSS